MKHIISIVIILYSCISYGQKSIPSTTLKSLEGKNVNVNSLLKDASYTVVSFWATWCVPCRKELELLKTYEKDWQRKYKTQIIAVTADDAKTLPKVKPLLATKKWNYIHLSDVDKKFQIAMGIPNVPYTLILNAKGEVVYSHSGFANGDEVELDKKVKAFK
jgi:cytochrome c biogenesis protein CcmG, thiol:disulfide interchange protein DsbE